jgi:hypothetical protein
MMRADFWCRVVGWLQIAGGFAAAAMIYAVGKAVDLEALNTLAATVLPAILIVFVAVPPLVSGFFTLWFARGVSEELAGRGGREPVVLRVFMGLAGLWSAGVVGIFGVGAPQMGFFAILGLITLALAIIGTQRTATLIGDSNSEKTP